MSHPFFNVVLPDAGDHGGRLLGEYSAPLMERITEEVLGMDRLLSGMPRTRPIALEELS